MPSSLTRYLLLVCLPVLGIGLTAQLLTHGRLQTLRMESGVLAGKTAGLVFREEMRSRAAKMSERAPVIVPPDPSVPAVAAALDGDTVAALGTISGELVLSVALPLDPEESDLPDSASPGARLRIRGLTETFQPRALSLLRGRTGHRAALYFRGRRVLAAPPEFAPDSVTAPPTSLEGDPHRTLAVSGGSGVLLPLNPWEGGALPLALLVSPPENRAESPLETAAPLLLLVLTCGLGALALVRFRRPGLSTILPLGVCWIILLSGVAKGEERFRDLRRGSLVRVLALWTEAGGPGDLTDLARLTGYQAVRIRDGDILLSTTENQDLQEAAARIPAPEPGFPGTGPLPEGAGSLIRGPRGLYGAVWDDEGALTVLLDVPARGSWGGLRLPLTVLGGMGSLPALLFLLFARRGREDHLVTETGRAPPS